MFIQRLGWEYEFVFGGRIIEVLILVVKHEDSHPPINFEGFLLVVVEDQSTTESSLASFAGLMMDRFSPYGHHMVRRRWAFVFFGPRQREWLRGVKRLAAPESNDHQHSNHSQYHSRNHGRLSSY